MVEHGLGPILCYHKIDPAIPIIVAQSGTALLAINLDPGLLTRNRAQLAVAIAAQPKTTTSIEPCAFGPDVKEVLAKEYIFIPVTVGVRDAHTKHRSELRFKRERPCFEMIAPVQEHYAFQHRQLQLSCPWHGITQHIVDSSLGKGVVAGKSPADLGKALGDKIQAIVGDDFLQDRIERCLEQLDHAEAVKVAVINSQGLGAVVLVGRIAAPITGDEIQPAIAVKITR